MRADSGSAVGRTPEPTLPTNGRALMGLDAGIVAAILAAAVWAGTSVLLASQLGQINAAMVSAIRLLWAALVFLLLLAAGQSFDGLRELGWNNTAQLVGSAVIGLALGDTVYVATLGILGAGRAYTASLGLFTVFTFSLSALLLDEPVTVPVVLGAALVIAAVYLVSLLGGGQAAGDGSAGDPALTRERAVRGLILVAFAALCWAIATVWLGYAGADKDPVAVGAVRIPAAALVIGALVSARRDSLRRWSAVTGKAMLTLAVAGVLGTGFGSLLFIYAVQEAGAGKTAVLSSLSPLFAVPLGAIFLGEAMTWWVAVGTVLAVAGIMLVSA